MIAGQWKEERVLITVKTYPVPSARYRESSCTGGITEDGRLIRLFPMPFRYLEKEQKFKRYTWIKVQVRKSDTDSRPESYKPDLDSIVLEEHINARNRWEERRKIIDPFVSKSLEDLKVKQLVDSRSMGIIKPKIIDFYMKPAETIDWAEEEKFKLNKKGLFDKEEIELLEKVPVEFRYRFNCDDPGCNGHDMQCLDWEVYQSYRKWKRTSSGPLDLEGKLIAAYKDYMIDKCDTHFFIGTLVNHPQTWTIGGLFFPQKKTIDGSVQRRLPFL